MSYALLGAEDSCHPADSCDGIAGEYQKDWPTAASRPSSLDFQITCPETGCQAATGFTSASIQLYWLRIDLADLAPPELTAPPSTGLFSTGRALRGQEPVAFTATDKGGGVFTAALVVDDVERDRWVVDENAGACLQPFVKRVPCKLTATSTHAFDTTGLSDGAHEVELFVYDATEVNKATFGPVDVVVDNTSPPPGGGGGAGSGGGGGAAQEPPADAGDAVDAPQAAASGAGPGPLALPAAARIVPSADLGDGLIATGFGKPVRISGVLLDDLRRPIAHATLQVFAATDEPGSRPEPIGTATTTESGTFSYTVGPGPSRTITVDYRPLGATSKPIASLAAHVVVRAALKLGTSHHRLRNGHTLTLTAHVKGAGRHKRNAKVAFQVLIGRTWRTFARSDADAHGTARARHRFRVTFTTVRYRFRALTLAARGFPYTAGHSKVVTVLVRP